jgi:hypothetical protein
MKHILSISLILFILAGLLNSCKESPNDGVLKESKVEFAFSSGQIKSANGQGLTNVVISVEDLQGNVVLNSEKIDIYHMNGRYISESVALTVGDYKLKRFLVLNGENDVVYATPIEGSDKADLVNDPLPINFYISEDSITEVTPEVVNVADSNPEDFGYVSFSFEIADSFKIKMGAAVLDSLTQNYKLTNAHVDIFSGETLVYEGELNPYSANMDSLNYDTLDLVNEITLPEAYNEFTIIVTKWEYSNYVNTFSKEELRLYYREEDKGPLIAILETACQLPDGSANFDAYPSIQVWPDATVFFDNNSIGDADEYIWDFGDSTKVVHTTRETGFPHTYEAPGEYKIKLMVIKDGCIDEETQWIRISIVFAGDSQTVTVDSTYLNADEPVVGTGIWTVINGGGTIMEPENPKTMVKNLTLGINTFRWTVTYDNNDYWHDVNITYNP